MCPHHGPPSPCTLAGGAAPKQWVPLAEPWCHGPSGPPPARKRTLASRLPAAPRHQTPRVAGGGEGGDGPPGSPHRAAGGTRALGPVGLAVSWAAGREVWIGSGAQRGFIDGWFCPGGGKSRGSRGTSINSSSCEWKETD